MASHFIRKHFLKQSFHCKITSLLYFLLWKSFSVWYRQKLIVDSSHSVTLLHHASLESSKERRRLFVLCCCSWENVVVDAATLVEVSDEVIFRRRLVNFRLRLPVTFACSSSSLLNVGLRKVGDVLIDFWASTIFLPFTFFLMEAATVAFLSTTTASSSLPLRDLHRWQNQVSGMRCLVSLAHLRWSQVRQRLHSIMGRPAKGRPQ